MPVGPGNHLDPEGPDLGQPTHFFPRRSQFVFKVNVPADFGDSEVVWTLTSKGKTEQAYATLRPEYMVNETVIDGQLRRRGHHRFPSGHGGQTRRPR